jgi:hypothetical protein
MYKYRNFFWSTGNNRKMGFDYCIVIDNKVQGWLDGEVHDESIVWNTACALADRYQEQLGLEGHDVHQQRNRDEMSIDFIEVRSAYMGWSSYHNKIHTLSVQELRQLEATIKEHEA